MFWLSSINVYRYLSLFYLYNGKVSYSKLLITYNQVIFSILCYFCLSDLSVNSKFFASLIPKHFLTFFFYK